MALPGAGRFSDRKVLVGQLWLSAVGRNVLPFLAALVALYFMHLPRRSYVIVSAGLLVGAAIWAAGLVYLPSTAFVANRPRSQRARRKYAIPLEIPPQSLFIGRQEETQEVAEFLEDRDDDEPRVVVLFGGPGIGKTALATHIAHEVSHKYPAGQFFIRLDEQSRSGTMVDATLKSLVEGLEGSEAAASGAPLQERFTQLTADRRVLFLLDDVSDAEDVRAVLSAGPGCAVLVTARGKLDELTSAFQKPVGPLSTDEATTLLGAIIGDERVADEGEAARRIAEAAEGQPLAIRLVGTSLADEPYASLDLAVERLLSPLEPHSPERSLPTALGLSVLSLTEEERNALSLLGLRDDPIFAPWMLQALLGANDASVRRIVESLVRARLLERLSSDVAGTALFRVHEQVLAFAATLLDRETTHEQRALLRMRFIVAEELRNRPHALQSAEIEIFRLLESGELAEALQRARDAVSLGRDQRDRTREALALTALAQVHCELGNLQEAEELARTALQMGEPLGERRALHCLGVLMRRKRHYAEGGRHLCEALDVPVEGDQRETVRILRDLAVLQAEVPDAANALESAERALDAAAHLPDGGAVYRAGVLWAKGRVLRRAARWGEAEALLADALAACAEGDQPVWTAWIDHEIACCMFEHGDLVGAELHAVYGLGIFALTQHRYGVAHCRLLLGRIFTAAGRPADASRVLGVALKDFQSCGDPWIEAESARVLAGVRAREDRSAEAMRLFDDAASAFAELDDEPSLILVYRERAAGEWLGLRRRVGRWLERARPAWSTR